MEPSEILARLLALAEDAGVGVRVVRASEGEPPPRSALCRIRGRPVLVLSAAEPLDARIEVAAAALRAHGGALLEQRFLPPAVRDRLEGAGPDHRGNLTQDPPRRPR